MLQLVTTIAQHVIRSEHGVSSALSDLRDKTKKKKKKKKKKGGEDRGAVEASGDRSCTWRR